ncbi:hypothetical protein [Sorangium sp. So ce887]|uniref:hypothetical protein n=1 Tax=Sorangium sp. So ce887 TaxID=3133324 RepID=UPI003F6387D1
MPSAEWETRPIPDIWRSTPPVEGDDQSLNAHDFFKYALLLRSMKENATQEDAIVWFDDALFFLRGGHDFFCYLNLSSDLTMRGRIFGGLNHAQQPAQRLIGWFHRLIQEASARDAATVDIFVAEEINSGSSAHRTMNVVRDALESLPSATTRITVDFWYYLACTDDSIFDPAKFQMEIQNKRRVDINNIIVRNNFRLFQGPLLAYDEERYSGLRVNSRGADAIEDHVSIRYRAGVFQLVCPDTGEIPFLCAPGENDLDNFVGVTLLNLLGVGGAIPHQVTARRVTALSCAECKHLFSQLRGPATTIWPSRLL